MVTRTAAVEEAVVGLDVNGRRIAVWTCTPENAEALVVGRLRTEGYIERREELLGFAVDDDGAGVISVQVRLPPGRVAAAEAERRHRADHGCGLLHDVRCAPERIRGRAGALAVPSTAVFAELFRELYAAADRYHESGGMHSAALSDGERLFFQNEEVGRHNAVDKVIGGALLAGHDPAEFGLVLTARVSGEIALKAARTGLAWVASRSVPTTLAVRIAAVAGTTLIARAASKEPRVYVPGMDG